MIKFNLEQAINELDITPNRLAVLAEVRPNTIGDLIKGNTKRIELDTIEKILDALNYESARKNKKYYQIQNIVQYETENAPELKFGTFFDKETFIMLKTILESIRIHTKITGLEITTITKLLKLNEEKLIAGIELPASNNVEQALMYTKDQLTTYYLAEYVHLPPYNFFRLTEKGKEFVKLLKKYGES